MGDTNDCIITVYDGDLDKIKFVHQKALGSIDQAKVTKVLSAEKSPWKAFFISPSGKKGWSSSGKTTQQRQDFINYMDSNGVYYNELSQSEMPAMFKMLKL